MNRAVFLDRDGVLIEDMDLLTSADQLQLLPGIPVALERLHDTGFKLVVITNQPVVARGLCTEAEVRVVHERMERLLARERAPRLDRIYFCPHHPNATLPAYRVDCECRKPKPGLLVRAAQELHLDLQASFAVGDRITDIIAGARAGCRTILVRTGRHEQPPIETAEPLDVSVQPDHACADLPAATDWILMQSQTQCEA